MISLIACISKPNHVIGAGGLIPWYLPEDFKHFKQLTFNHPLIMGRKTFESINEKVRPLPGRLNIVVTRSDDTADKIRDAHPMLNKETNTGLIVAGDLGYAIMAADIEGKTGWDASETFIIGGESLYREAIEDKLVDKMYLTYIDQEIEGDTFFPVFDQKAWAHQLIGGPSSHHGLDYTFWEYTAPWAPKLHVEHSE